MLRRSILLLGEGVIPAIRDLNPPASALEDALNSDVAESSFTVAGERLPIRTTMDH